MWPFKKKSSSNRSILSPSEFLSDAVLELHNNAQRMGYAKKGFILHEGLLEIGNVFIAEGLRTQPDLQQRDNSFYLSLAASNLQTGFVLARQACIDKNSITDGSFFALHETVESMYNEFVVGLEADLNITIDDWEKFRQYIVPLWIKMIQPYKSHPLEETYNAKLMAAYYMLGISIGLEKYEP